jgi:hypothetical protein
MGTESKPQAPPAPPFRVPLVERKVTGTGGKAILIRHRKLALRVRQHSRSRRRVHLLHIPVLSLEHVRTPQPSSRFRTDKLN